MADKQTRRSVTISVEVYDRLRAYAERIRRPMSRIVERDVLAPVLGLVVTPDADEGGSGES